MSLNVGERGSKYVSVYDVSMKFNFSEKALVADLRTSSKTGNPKLDKETGEIITDENGEYVPERKYSSWRGIFVGNAFESAKSLKDGTLIDITTGWIEQNTDKRTGKVFYNVFISDFELSKLDDGEQAEEQEAQDE